ncbi:TonB-dependent receptor [Novosphingobium jiangmenense]|uniref:TonB-dependent receptor n=1 Tax=Novosphingobium jiangmenense TaxID=2791981 RepID=A0ABS0HB51_9SPHN|nr:TonB-dependent receptor [Novosphingobium jiangmenense]MBF9149507.1 TonB-dependent receptor [Novosphingobium jiangmenense]
MRKLIPLLFAAAPVPAMAQDLNQIVVNAPGGMIDLDEARALDLAAIDASGRPDLGRALERVIPGLTLGEAAGNPWQASLNWRGFSAGALQGMEQGLAVYLDGVRFNQPFGDVVLLDLVPDSVLVSAQVNDANPVLGRNALAGSLLVQTGDGVNLAGLKAQSDLDSHGMAGGAVSYGTGTAQSNLALAFEARHDKGWRVASPSTLYRGFAKGVHQGEGWGIELSALGASTDLTGNGVSPVELLDAKYDAVFTRPDTTRTRFARVVAAPWLATGDTSRVELRAHWQYLDRANANGDLADFGPCEADPAQLCVEDDDDNYSDALFSRGNPVAADAAGDEAAVFNRGKERTRAWGATLQWQDTVETSIGTRRIALGGTWEHAHTRFGAQTDLGELEEDRSVEDLGLPLVSADGAIQPVSLVSKLDDFALFASVALPLTSALSVEAGARYSHNRVVMEDQLGTALNGRHHFNRFNPSVEFDYALAPGIHATAGFSLTSRNPTPAELSCADPEAPCTLANFFIADPPLKQVTATNWHAGVSATGKALAWRVNAWRSETSNDIRMIASSVRGRAYFANLGHTLRQGVEASAEWRRNGWHASANYAFTDARFRDGFIMSSPSNPAADGDGTVMVRRGDRLPAVPRHALNLRLAREEHDWSAGLTMRARSGQYLAGDEGNDNPRTPAYAVFDLDGSVSLAPGLRVVAQLRNVLNKRYATFGTFSEVDEVFLAEAPGAEDPRAYAPGAPRRLTVSLRAEF